MNHRVQVRVTSSGDNGSSGVDVSWVIDGLLERKTQTLSDGFNAVTVPADAQAVAIIPPSDNTETLVLKGVTGDTGVPLSATGPNFVSLDGSGDDIGITAGGSVDVELVFL